MKLLGLAGWSGAGKTTLLIQLLPHLRERGLRVSTLKHAHHAFDIDQPGKDSYAHRAAGAYEVLVASSQRWALMHEHRGSAEPKVKELLRHLSPVDLVLVEGYKNEEHPKIEIHRPGLKKPLLAPNDSSIIAIASDTPMEAMHVPILDLNNVKGIADFVYSYCGKESWPN